MGFSFRRSFRRVTRSVRRVFRRVGRAVGGGFLFDSAKGVLQDVTGITAQKKAAKAAQLAEANRQAELKKLERKQKLAEQQSEEDAKVQKEIAQTQTDTTKKSYDSDFSGLLLNKDDDDEDEDDILIKMLKKG